jgi:hypothetical protein
MDYKGRNKSLECLKFGVLIVKDSYNFGHCCHGGSIFSKFVVKIS